MNRKWWLVSAASAVLALTAAACGSSNDNSSGVSGDLAGAGSSAQQAAQEAWIAKFEDQNSGATVSYDAIGSGGGRDQFIAGGKTAFAGSDSPFDTTELPKATQRCSRRVASWSRSRTTSRRSRRLQPVGRRQPAARSRTRSRRSSRARSRPGMTRPSRRTTRASTCPARRSLRCTVPTSPGRRPTSRTTSMGRAERLDVRSGRQLAAEDRRVRRPDLWSDPGGQGRRRCDRLRRREPGRRTSASPRSRSATPTWLRALRVRRTTSTSRRRTRSSARPPVRDRVQGRAHADRVRVTIRCCSSRT